MREQGDSHRALNLAKSSDDLALLVRPEHLVPLSSLTDYLGFRVRRRRPSFKVGLDVVPVRASVGGGGGEGRLRKRQGLLSRKRTSEGGGRTQRQRRLRGCAPDRRDSVGAWRVVPVVSRTKLENGGR